jgi:glycosyltransferase involved in cell wall biosynthesis
MYSPQYVVVSPVRNEEKYLPFTIASMSAQTEKPKKWVLVDDGSADQTGDLIDEAARKYQWILTVHRRDRGSRLAGTGVMEAFYEGYALLTKEDWDFIVKLDGDLSFRSDYFESCFKEFQTDSKLGIAGGTCCKLVNDKPVTEFKGEPAFHVRGPTKIYRRECFDAIGGLIRTPGWDTVDQIKANMLGWKTLTFPHIKLIHHRATGGAYGARSDWIKNGLANYITGYDPVFMICKCIKRILARPTISGIRNGIALWCGYLKGYIKRIPQVDDPEMIRYLRIQQWRALTFRPSLWR